MENKEQLYQYDNIIYEGEYLYYFACRLSVLIQVKISTAEAKIIFFIDSPVRYRSFIKVGDKFIFFPVSKGEIITFNKETDVTKKIAMPEKLHLEEENNWSSNYIVLNDSLFFYWQNPVITRYDFLTDRWCAYRDWKLNIDDENITHWLSKYAFEFSGFLYFHIGYTNKLLKFNPINGSTTVIELDIPEKIEMLSRLCSYNNEIWIVGEIDSVRCGIYKGIISENNNIPCTKINEINGEFQWATDFQIILRSSDELWLLPGRYDVPYRIDIAESEAKVASEIPVISRNNLKNDFLSAMNYNEGVFGDRCYYTIHPWSESLVTIKNDSEEVVVKNISFSEHELNKYNAIAKLKRGKYSFNESDTCNIRDLILLPSGSKNF